MPDLERLLDQMSEAAVCCDRDGIVVYVNAAGGRMFGRAPADWIGMPWSRAYAEGDQERIRLALERARQGERDTFELFDEMRERWWVHEVYPQGERVCAIVRDVTQEKQTAARFEILANASREFAEPATDVRSVFDRIARHIAEVMRDLCS